MVQLIEQVDNKLQRWWFIPQLLIATCHGVLGHPVAIQTVHLSNPQKDPKRTLLKQTKKKRTANNPVKSYVPGVSENLSIKLYICTFKTQQHTGAEGHTKCSNNAVTTQHRRASSAGEDSAFAPKRQGTLFFKINSNVHILAGEDVDIKVAFYIKTGTTIN